MLVRFTKMHGLGNDFVVIDLITQRIRIDEDIVKRLGDRQFGIGFDQLLLIETPTDPDMDFKYRIFNSDGTEVEHCGNGARCFARFVIDKRLTGKQKIAVQTQNGPIYLNLVGENDVRVDMGKPHLRPADIPFKANEQAAEYTIEADGQRYQIGAVSMGNPHGVLVVDSVKDAPVGTLGPKLEVHPDFPQKANIGFMEVIDRNHIKLRVFERGAGETLACGTGACAAVVSGQLRGLLDKRVEVTLRGGKLIIEWQGGENPVIMTGPATTVFEGQIHI